MSKAPHFALLNLNLSRSPLLPGLGLQLPPLKDESSTASDDIISALLTKRTLDNMNLNGGLAYAAKPTPYPRSHTGAHQSSSSASSSFHSTEDTPVTSAMKPLPSLPIATIPLTGIPPQAIISLLDLLDSFDVDVVCEVARVTENIKEARALVKAHKAQCADKQARAKARLERQLRETKDIDSDFWLGV